MIFRYYKKGGSVINVKGKEDFFNMLHRDLDTETFKIKDEEVECEICPWFKCTDGNIYLIAQKFYGIIGLSNKHIKELV